MAFFPDELRKCVAFVGYKDSAGKLRLAGSGFWISKPGPADIANYYRPAYFVTAAHVIEKAKKDGADGKVWLRLNTKTGEQLWHETLVMSWKTHPTEPSVDLAILKLGIDKALDHVTWPLESCVLNESIDTEATGNRKVELGDEVCFAGLFHPHSGERKNIPIVRIGNISALRDEPVLNRQSVLMDVYLVECRSFGGLSGSPVFIDIITAKSVRPPSYGFTAQAYAYESPSRFKLFGIIHGHFGHEVEAGDAVVQDDKQRLDVNFGIAMVVPAEKINGILARYAEEESFEAEDARRNRSRFIVQDAVNTPNVTVGMVSTTSNPNKSK